MQLHAGRRPTTVVGGLALAAMISGCAVPAPSAQHAPTSSAAAVASAAPSPSDQIPVRTPAPSPAPRSTEGPSATAAPRPTPAPISSLPPAVMERFYAALRPANLRVADGPPVLARGSGATLAFELLNTSGAPVDAGRAGMVPLGAVQGWLEPAGAGASVDGCAGSRARRGAQLAAGGRQVSVGGNARGGTFGPTDGLTLYTAVPPDLTACLPAGRYRYTLEYLRLGEGQGVVASAALDVTVADPTAWSARLDAGNLAVTAALESVRGGTELASRVAVRGLAPREWAWVAVRSGGCQRPGVPLLPPATVAASGGAGQVARRDPIAPAARAALAPGAALSLWVTVSEATRCAPFAPAGPAGASAAAPTTWAGGRLAAAVPGSGLRVSASSETVGGSLEQVADGRIDATWNSGRFAPAWVELDLGRTATVSGVRLLPAMAPSTAATVHRVYGRAAGASQEALLAEVRGTTSDGVWTSVTFPKPARVRYIRVATVESPSWVAWREIAVLGPGLPKPSLLPTGTHDTEDGVAASADQCIASGWAVDPDDPQRHVAVRILVDGKQAWLGAATQPRPDVLAAGFGSGTNGFGVPLGDLMSHDRAHDVLAQARDDETGRWVDLNSTPKMLTCP